MDTLELRFNVPRIIASVTGIFKCRLQTVSINKQSVFYRFITDASTKVRCKYYLKLVQMIELNFRKIKHICVILLLYCKKLKKKSFNLFFLLYIRNLKTYFFRILFSTLRVGIIPTLHLKTFEQLFWPTNWRKNSRKVQWQAQSRYLCHCAFLVSSRYAGSEKTWPNHFISISLALVTLPAVLRKPRLN